jgi:hypothetical protein
MRTMIRRASLSVLVLCACTACASAGGGTAGQPGTRAEQNVRFVQMTNESRSDFVFHMLGDSVGGRGLLRVPLAETGILPSYEVAWTPRR